VLFWKGGSFETGVGAGVGVNIWSGKEIVMKEIVKVKNDHGVLSIRIPQEFIRAKGITRRDSLVWVHNRKGDLVLKTLMEGINHDQKNDDGEGG